jgi:glycosyltransferase involved in cell wall biosynthesis
MIEALGISKSVEMKGVVAPHDIRTSMEKASLLVQHSITTPINGDKEGTPAVVMEALATGLPIVATEHAGIQELVETGKNGVLVQELDYHSMANEIVKLLKDRDTLRKLSSGAVKSISNNELITDHNRHMELILKRAISQE